MVDSALFSSARQDWSTPDYIYAYLDSSYHFELDVCANDHNYKCKPYFTEQENGLKREWTFVPSAFMNPPYGRKVGDWVRKAYSEAEKGMIVVCLIAARTDTSWWHDCCMYATEIWLIRGRVHFTKPGVTKTAPATFPSAIVIFDGLNHKLPNAHPKFRKLSIDRKTETIQLI